MRKREVKRYIKFFILLAPILFFCCTLLGQQSMSVADIVAELPMHDLLVNVSYWLEVNLGFSINNFGEFALSYGAYIIIVEMVEVIMNLLLCIPKMCNKFLGGE